MRGCGVSVCNSIGGSWGMRGAMAGGLHRSLSLPTLGPPLRKGSAVVLSAGAAGASRGAAPRSATSSSDQSLKLSTLERGDGSAFPRRPTEGGGVRGPLFLLPCGCCADESSSDKSESAPRDRFRFRSRVFFLDPFLGEYKGCGPSWGAAAGGSGLKRSPELALPTGSSSLRPFFKPFLWDFVFFLPSSCGWEPAVSLSSLPVARAKVAGSGVESLPLLRDSLWLSTGSSPRLSPRPRSPRGSKSSRWRVSLLSKGPLRSSSFQCPDLSSDEADLGGVLSKGSWGRTTWLSRRCLSPGRGTRSSYMHMLNILQHSAITNRVK